MTIALAGLMYNKSYAYVTRHDFLRAYGRNQTVFVTKNLKKLILDYDEPTTSSKNVHHPFLFLLSEVHKSIDLKLVNTQQIKVKRREPNMSLLCDEKLPVDRLLGLSRQSRGIEKITLFRRRLRTKKFMETTKEEREALANLVLSRQISKSQSHFSSQPEELPPHPDEQEFIHIGHPVDIDYHASYSIEEPSVHDLFDLEEEPTYVDYVEDNFIEEEHLEDDE